MLGLAVYAAQRVEFVLYGLASHAAHLPEAQKNKRFRALNPEQFLRGDISELKATLGQLCTAFGDAFLIKTSDLVKFYRDRNLIAHNFFRIFHANIKGVAAPKETPCDFLRTFIAEALYWENILQGLLYELMSAAAEREGRQVELVITESHLEKMRVYREHVARFLSSK